MIKRLILRPNLAPPQLPTFVRLVLRERARRKVGFPVVATEQRRYHRRASFPSHGLRDDQ